YRFDRDLELAVGEVASAQLGYYGFPIPHNFRGGAHGLAILLYKNSPRFVPTKINKALISRGRRSDGGVASTMRQEPAEFGNKFARSQIANALIRG
ncbi:MAG: hypothetical protein WCB58_04805, partial [Acidobacteriaceae bacterium]